MSDSTTKIFLVAGATRGIGLALVAEMASKYPSAIVYAGARDPSGPGTSALKKVAEEYPERVEIVKYVAADEEGNKAMAKYIGDRHGKVDVVIANAGIYNSHVPINEIDIDLFKQHFSVNVIGPVVLFQAFYHLLKASDNPKFVPITSLGGSIAFYPPVPTHGTCYGSTKAALNWVARKLHFENDWLVCFPLSPGAVDTDMLNAALAADVDGAISQVIANDNGMLSPPAAASTLVDIIETSTRENEGGQFVHVDRSRLPW